MTVPIDTKIKIIAKLNEKEHKYGYVRPQSYKNKPIDYIDPAPRPIILKIPFGEYVERVKRIKLDAWQRNFCQRLEDAAVGRTEKRVWAVIHAEGQLGKSIILVQAFSAWLLGHDPLHRIALATYNVTRSQRHSKVVIGIMNLAIHKQIFTDPDGWVDEKTSKEKWSTAARIKLNDGQDSFNPVGLQSGLTGSGFDTLLIDDPYADQKEAFSETIRTNLQEFWDFTVMSRMGTHTNVFGMFHRYHVEDLAGYLLDKGQFDYWRYATICDGPYIHDETGQKFEDPLGRQIGEYISPERRPPHYYNDARKNSRVWNSMFQGRPSSEEGEFFQVTKLPRLSPEETLKRRQECAVIVRAWDGAATEAGGDYSVGTEIGMSADKRVTIFSGVRAQVESAGRDELQLRTAHKDGFDTVITFPDDPGAAGKTALYHVTQLLKDFTVSPRSTSGSKEDRARSFASAVNSGMVDFGSDVDDEFFKEAKKELRNFPLSDHDDIVDSCADGYNECFERISKGLVVKNFSVTENLQLWAEFAIKFGAKIPVHWTTYAALRITPDASMPNSAVIVTRAAQNTGLTDTLFVVAEYKEYTSDYELLFEWLDATLKEKCDGEKTVTVWLHPDSEQYRTMLWQKYKRMVMLFAGNDIDGITELNWYIGEGKLKGLITSDQLVVAADSRGLYAFRQEAMTWGYNQKGEPNGVGAVLDCLRLLTHNFRTMPADFTREEKIEMAMPQYLKTEHIQTMPEHARDLALSRRQIEEKRITKEMDAPIRGPHLKFARR